MAVEREYAVIGEEINLRIEFYWEDIDGNLVLFDPAAVDDVEILDEQNVAVQTVLAADVVRDGVGEYHVVIGPYTDSAKLFDRWTYTTPNGASEYVHPGWCDVRTTEGAALPSVVEDTGQVYLNVFLEETKQVYQSLQIYIYDAVGFVWAGTTDNFGRVNPVLDVGDYRVILYKEGWVFRHNAFPLTVVAGSVNRRYVYTDSYETQEPVVNRVDTADTCLVKFYFGKLDGSPLQDDRVIVESTTQLEVTGTLAETIIIPHGSVEARLSPFGVCSVRAVRGAEVTVYVEGSSFSRRVTVPSQAEVNFADLTGEPDRYTMLQLTPPPVQTEP